MHAETKDKSQARSIETQTYQSQIGNKFEEKEVVILRRKLVELQIKNKELHDETLLLSSRLQESHGIVALPKR